MAAKRQGWGGARIGAGRPQKRGEPTVMRAIRFPVSIDEQIWKISDEDDDLFFSDVVIGLLRRALSYKRSRKTHRRLQNFDNLSEF